ncbi:MAG: autotransporter outer membrane beta-barrel domain-containing protein [Selenomonadaceae bacterium]|nr:autotransporter outer membrane beta-barrel domain-containing protein [Selenomonadaceae bacterium]
MTKRRMKSLTRQILLGMMAAGVLWGGFAAQVEAKTISGEISGDVAAGSTDTLGDNVNASNKTLDVVDGAYTNGPGYTLYGGKNESTGVANSNTVNITGGSFEHTVNFNGGFSQEGNVSSNIVNVSGGTFNKAVTIYGGNAFGSTAKAEGNKVIVTGGTFKEGAQICGGSSTSMTEGDVDNNTVTIKGGTFEGDIMLHGSMNPGTKNTVSIEGGDFSAANVTVNSDIINIKVASLTLAKIADPYDGTQPSVNLRQLNFYIPNTVTADSTILTINGGEATNLTNTKVSAGVANGSPLTKGDKVTLLYNENTITTTGMTTGKLTDAGFLNYDLTIAKSADEKSLIATIGSASGLSADSKSIAETRAGGIAILNDGATLMAGTSLLNAKAAAHAANLSAQGGEGAPAPAGFTPFAAVGANNMRYNTGSHVDSKGWGINVGMARELTYKKSVLTIAPLIEYGRSSYDSYLDSGTHGSGKQQFLGVGAVVRQDFAKGAYVEGSLRAGRMKGDYNSGDLNASYDTASNYLGLHLGVGKILKLDKKNKLDIYGKLFYTKQGSDDVTLSTGAVYNLESIDSFRTRLGARWTAELAKNSNLYVGLAWDHEFDSNARATYKGFSTPTPSMKGDSGLLELGWQVKPKETSPLSINLNLTGWCGKQKGVQFGAGFEWGF